MDDRPSLWPEMILPVLYLLAAIVAALFVGVESVHAALPAVKARQHARCLVRIAVLENELGIGLSNPELLPRPKTTPQAEADRWSAAVNRAAANYTQALSSGAWSQQTDYQRWERSIDKANREILKAQASQPYTGRRGY